MRPTLFLRLIEMLRAAVRGLMTSKTRVGAVEKLLRGLLMVPIFGVMLVLLRMRAMFSGPMRVETVTNDGDRFMCDLPDLIPLYLYMFSVWEPDLTEFIRSRLKPGDVFVDVGANIGYDTLLAARRVRDSDGGDRGSVVAIEASPTVFERLQETLQLNGSPAHVRLVNSAAAEKIGTLSLYSGPRTNLGLTTTVARAGMPKVAEVPARPLGDLLLEDENARVRLIKIDVEGGEDSVLAGLLGCIDRLPRDVEIAVELSPAWWHDRSKTAADVLKPLIERGFKVFTIPNNYWPWRYLWPKDVRAPQRLRDEAALTKPMKRLDVILSREEKDELRPFTQ